MREDFQDLFPFREVYYCAARNSSFASDVKRIAGIPQSGPKLGMFELWKRPTELRHAAADEEGFEIVAQFFSDFVNYTNGSSRLT